VVLTGGMDIPRSVERDERSVTVVATRQSRPRSPGAISKHSGAPCTKCNEIHTGCTGHKKNADPPRACRGNPVNGADTCHVHTMGGKRAEAAVERWRFAAVEGEIGKLLREADIPAQHPLDGLLEVVRHSGAMMRMLSLQCAALAERGEVGVNDDDFGKPHYFMRSEGLVGVDHEGDGAPHVLVTLYERWSLLHMRACKTALDANIDERLVRNAEATSEKFFRVFAQAVEAADLTVEQQARLRNTLAAGLRAMSPIDAKMMEAQGA
jgi:hypothetical protein